MSDTTTVPTPADVAPKAAEGEQPEQDGKTFDADYVDKLRKEAAKYRTEAKANADAAKRLAEIEEANKTAEQKAAERLAEAERKAVAIEARATRAEVAAATGIPVDILAGPKDFTAEAVTEYAEMVKAHFERTDTQRKQHNNIVPREGAPTPPLALNGDGIEAALRAKLGIA